MRMYVADNTRTRDAKTGGNDTEKFIKTDRKEVQQYTKVEKNYSINQGDKLRQVIQDIPGIHNIRLSCNFMEPVHLY